MTPANISATQAMTRRGKPTCITLFTGLDGDAIRPLISMRTWDNRMSHKLSLLLFT
jgi:hypothetical protein